MILPPCWWVKKIGSEKKEGEVEWAQEVEQNEKSRERNLGQRRKSGSVVFFFFYSIRTASVFVRVAFQRVPLVATPRSSSACTADIETLAQPGALSFAKSGTRCNARRQNQRKLLVVPPFPLRIISLFYPSSLSSPAPLPRFSLCFNPLPRADIAGPCNPRQGTRFGAARKGKGAALALT